MLQIPSRKSSVVRWKADFEKMCLLGCFDRRGWERCADHDNEWNVYWANTQSTRHLFSTESNYRLRDDQIINHFPNHFELTRKDLLVKNLKRYRKEVDKEGSFCTFLPPTYVLPTDYSLFLEEFRRIPNSMWIMKPTGKARGVGIFLVTKLNQVRKWASRTNGQDVYVISRYIERPLLIGGRKFDLRCYVLVTSYRPLKAYFYEDGFARFCNEKYTVDAAERDNQYIHLTNVAIQKHNEDYNENHGGKWSLSNLRLYLNSMFGSAATQKLFHDLSQALLHSLKAVQHVIMNDKHCFECYGYDVLIDENLKPWLIEVNASPALTATTKTDRSLKHSLLHNIFNIVVPTDLPEDGLERKRAFEDIVASSNFTILCDEEMPTSLNSSTKGSVGSSGSSAV
eukprot:CAMPEP_0184548688 /NCGR_PEP_ID=MMETSP0199_2-20130426/6352_1 /TAXON_ID=1112570 /ORGANISM="Thraustochytrium sp., Strain LLF1b" /LENGTH=396 /DNA_ID=CAMNT_0026943321 /DNA_START=231 /DNA_END=1417 /DNA_ORIENTATION=+